MNTNAATVGQRIAGSGVLADLPEPATFTMPTPPSANHLFKNVKGVGRVKSAHYDEFIRMGVAAIRRQGVKHVPGHVLAIIGVERMSARADIDNRLKATLDAIVKAEVIEDDRFVTGIALVWLPKANGLSHVSILPVQTLDLTFHPSQDGASGGWFINAPSLTGDNDDGYQPV
ncbi:RusA family crossover junction endodeoxyribonuclease [Brucella tritici]|uniref:RusA family crossover junction endodeoxyribonuclease n=1 Tax=Brucella tritici TaxID=94626 RepID=A0A7V7VSV1_9HYPH|nr:RusA family crossover junction endodeoxyribonuclease [Brucella tritici]KAB2656292.1 RusA family crossover junction endodeoxyribonuclease [Brucella tritici]